MNLTVTPFLLPVKKLVGAIVKMKRPHCEMIGINYGDVVQWDNIQEREVVYMVDFSLN